jgi:uncharacterized protein YqjF (DUF2071 family)
MGTKAVARATTAGVAADADAGACPHIVTAPLMDQDWIGLSFLHWRYDPADVARLLPVGLTLETFDGSAWVGLVPFLLRVRIPRGPALPWVGVFPETNVRTYVRGPDGARGIWFLSLDAPRRLAIWAARLSYHLPYHVAVMEMRCDAGARAYTSWRTCGAHRGASSRARVAVGERIAATDVTPLEHFLTARWRLYAPMWRGLGAARVEHAPWGLHRAVAADVDAHLLVAAGLPYPDGAPLVHACDDVHASLTRLRPCGGHPDA